MSGTQSYWEHKEVTVPLRHRKGTVQSDAAFGNQIVQAILEGLTDEFAADWEPDEPMDYLILRRANRIQWRTAFSFNPLGDMNRAVAATIRLKRRVEGMRRADKHT